MNSRTRKRTGWLRAWYPRVRGGRRRSPGGGPRKLWCELLERRELLSAAVVLGTQAFKTFQVSTTGGSLSGTVSGYIPYQVAADFSGTVAYASATRGIIYGSLSGPVNTPPGYGDFSATIALVQSSSNLSGWATIATPTVLAGSLIGTGSIDTTMFNVTVHWSGGGDTGSWSGTVVPTGAPPAFDIIPTTPQWDSPAHTQIDFGFTVAGTVHPVNSLDCGTPLACVRAYWASGTTPGTIIGSAIGGDTVPVYWNSAGGTASISGISSIPTGANYVLISVEDDSTLFPDGSNNLVAFSVRSPVVMGISTAQGPAQGPATGNTTVTISGAGFTQATAVDFGTVAASSYTVNSDAQITATSPAGTGVVDVTVATPGGTSASAPADQFSYAPVVMGISPAQGLVTGGTTVTITGAGLAAATASGPWSLVDFGTVAASSVTVDSDSQIVATSPAVRASGTVAVTVTTAGGTSAASTGDQFTYGRVNTSTAITTAPASSTYGASVTFTASVTPLSLFTPTGTVTFLDNGTTLGTGTLNGSGIATFTTSSLSVAIDPITGQITAHLITASYGGDISYNGSTSPAVNWTVNKATLAVTADNKWRAFDAADPTFTYSYSGFENGETPGTSGVSGLPSLASTDTTASPVGIYTIIPGLGTLAAKNYTFNFINGTLTVMPQVIPVNSPQSMESLVVSANVQATVGGGGKLTVKSAVELESGGAVNVSGGGMLTVPGIDSAAGALGLDLDGGILQAATAFTTAAPVTIGAGGATIDSNGNNLTFSGAMTGPGGVTLTGSGTVTLSAANSQTGGTFVSDGLLVAENSAAIPGGSLLSIGPGGSVVLGAPGASESLAVAQVPGAGPLQVAVAAAGLSGTETASLVVGGAGVTPAGAGAISPAVSDSALAAAAAPVPTAAVAPAAVDCLLAAQPVPGWPSRVLPASPVPHSDATTVDQAGGQPAGDATPRVAALRTAAAGQARDEGLLRFVEDRAGNAAVRAGNQQPATGLFGLDLQTLDLLAGEATKWQ
jgi:autotransporter-associated beta strand protein